MAELNIQISVVERLKNQPGGINHILEDIRTKHKIRVTYDKGTILKLSGQHEEILELEEENLKNIAGLGQKSKKSLGENGSVEKSLGENGSVEWTFLERQARTTTHLFEKELSELQTAGKLTVHTGNKKEYTDYIKVSCTYLEFPNVAQKVDKLVKDSGSCVKRQVHVDLKDKQLAKLFVAGDHRNLFYCELSSEENLLIFFGRNEQDCEKAKQEWLVYKAGKNTDPKNPENAKITGNAKTGEPPLLKPFVCTDTVDDKQPKKDKEASKPGSDSVENTGKGESAQTQINTTLHATTSTEEGNLDETLERSYSTRTPGVMSGSGESQIYKFDCSGMTVSVYKASITEIKGMDAITNAANDGLFHGGGVAYYISKAAGDKMNQECKEYIDKHNRIPVSENFVSNPGNMACMGIIHAVGPMWCDYKDKELCAKDLYRTVINVLESTKRKSWKSVAIPAISSGIFGVPKKLCAEMYIKAFVDFVDHGTVTDVHFIDVSQDILDMVIDAHKQLVNNPACLSFKNALQYHVMLSSKTTSRTTKRNTSNTEESSLIKFLREDTYFGQRRFQYNILDKLKLYVHSGDLLKLGNVDAIVVPLQPGMTGGALAEGVKKLGGDKYRKELEKNSIKKEGDVFVCCKYGEMKTDVIHVVLSPVTGTDTQTLTKYSAMIEKLFCKEKYPRVALPLVGSANLNRNDRSKLCKRILEIIIDIWTSAEKKTVITELHFVETDQANTTCLQNELKTMTSGRLT